MPKPTKGARLGGGPAHERMMLNQLAAQLFEHKRIQTTETKAKRLRPVAERLVTFAKRGDLHSRRRVMRQITDASVVHELFTEIAPLVENRDGGYTRIIKTGYRKGDRAPLAIVELVLEPVTPKQKKAAPAAEEAAVEETEATETEAAETEVTETEVTEEAPAEEAAEAASEETEEKAEEKAE